MTDHSKELTLARDCAERMLAGDRASGELGMRVEIPAPGQAIVRMTVSAKMLNGHDICHGGMVFALADSAFAFACNAYNRVTVAAGASIDFLAPARDGDQLIASASEVRRGRRAGLYDVHIRRDDGTLIAVFRGRSSSSDRPLIPAPAS